MNVVKSAWTYNLDQRQRLEIGALLLTAAAHLACFTNAQLRPIYLVGAVGGWAAYGLWTATRHPDVVRDWGFTRANLLACARPTAALVGFAAVVMALIGAAQGQLDPVWTLPVTLLLYPLWGLVQQWLVQGVLVRAMACLPGRASHPVAITLVAATAFGLVHWPYPALMVATVGLGLVATPLYLRHRNLWPLGVAHGWLGALLYHWVLGRNPLLEMLAAWGTG